MSGHKITSRSTSALLIVIIHKSRLAKKNVGWVERQRNPPFFTQLRNGQGKVILYSFLIDFYQFCNIFLSVL